MSPRRIVISAAVPPAGWLPPPLRRVCRESAGGTGGVRRARNHRRRRGTNFPIDPRLQRPARHRRGGVLAATRGSFKLGIQFVDWRVQGESYPIPATGPLMGRWPCGAAPPAGAAPLAASFPVTNASPTVMARTGRFQPPDTQGDAITRRFDYAYHFDATLYAGFLRRLAESARRPAH